MTPQEGNRAIAEWMGWNRCETSGTECWISKEGLHTTGGAVKFPDYHNDLNMMAEAIEKLDFNQQEINYRHLQKIVRLWGDTSRWYILIANATAPQRWEAILRTLDFWKD